MLSSDSRTPLTYKSNVDQASVSSGEGSEENGPRTDGNKPPPCGEQAAALKGAGKFTSHEP